MTLNYPTDIAPREGEGITDADIAAALAASGLTYRPIVLDDLRRYLRDEGLLMLAVPSGWTGTLSAVAADPDTSDLLRQGIYVLASILQQETRPIPTDAAADAARFAAVVDGLLAAGVITAEHRAAVYALAGGERFAGVTGADVTACRADYQRDAAVAAMLNDAQGAWMLAQEQDGYTAETVRQAMLDALAGGA